MTLHIKKDTITTLTLHRPDKRNALNNALITDLIDALNTLNTDSAVKLVILQSDGVHFCAGADIQDMRESIHHSHQENYDDAEQLATLFHTLYTLSQPTIALVQGAALGGGAGLVACCDISIAAEDARFAFPETRLGLIPATIAPYVVRAVGPHAAKRLFITGESISSAQALHLGLVHHIAKSGKLSLAAKPVCQAILKNGPEAVKQAKALVNTHCAPIDPALCKITSQWIADRRLSDEAQTRLMQFLT